MHIHWGRQDQSDCLELYFHNGDPLHKARPNWNPVLVCLKHSGLCAILCQLQKAVEVPMQFIFYYSQCKFGEKGVEYCKLITVTQKTPKSLHIAPEATCFRIAFMILCQIEQMVCSKDTWNCDKTNITKFAVYFLLPVIPIFINFFQCRQYGKISNKMAVNRWRNQVQYFICDIHTVTCCMPLCHKGTMECRYVIKF